MLLEEVMKDTNDILFRRSHVWICAGFRPPGRLPIPALLRPAAEKRQGTKSRDVGGGGAAGAMGILPRAQACG
jgi:hypothetical protein